MAAKIGRNDPCWCGCGKKYKSCHMAFDDKIATSTYCEQAKLSMDTNVTFGNVDTAYVQKDAKDTSGAAGSINRIVGSVLTIVQVIGCGVAVIMLIVLAIKYISAAPGDKADIKKHAVVYVVGAVVLFAASGILQIVKNFASNVQA